MWRRDRGRGRRGRIVVSVGGADEGMSVDSEKCLSLCVICLAKGEIWVEWMRGER